MTSRAVRLVIVMSLLVAQSVVGQLSAFGELRLWEDIRLAKARKPAYRRDRERRDMAEAGMDGMGFRQGVAGFRHGQATTRNDEPIPENDQRVHEANAPRVPAAPALRGR